MATGDWQSGLAVDGVDVTSEFTLPTGFDKLKLMWFLVAKAPQARRTAANGLPLCFRLRL
jgi:hypothetical protein